MPKQMQHMSLQDDRSVVLGAGGYKLFGLFHSTAVDITDFIMVNFSDEQKQLLVYEERKSSDPLRDD